MKKSNGKADVSEDVNSLDARILLWLQRHSNPLADKICVSLRHLVTDEGIFLLTILLIWLTSAPMSGIIIMLCIGVGETLNGAIKFAIGRPRPFWVMNNLRNPAGGFEPDYSFPSSHAQTVSTFVTACLIEFRPGILISTLLILLVLTSGLARLYLGVHWPSDVIIGWLIGIGISVGMNRLDLFEWFGLLHLDERFALAVTIPIAAYGLLVIARLWCKEPTTETLIEWESQALHNSPTAATKGRFLKVYEYERYIHTIFSLAGGTIASSLALQDLTLRFFIEECTIQSDTLAIIKRMIVGFIGITLLVPFIFLLPGKIWSPTRRLREKIRPASPMQERDEVPSTKYVSHEIFSFRRCLSFLIHACGVLVADIWIIYGCAAVSQNYFGAYCPLLKLPIQQPLFSDMDISQYSHVSGSVLFGPPSQQLNWITVDTLPLATPSAPTQHECNFETYPGHRGSGLNNIAAVYGQPIHVMKSVAQIQQEVLDAIKYKRVLRVVAMALSPQTQKETLENHRTENIRFITVHDPAFRYYKKHAPDTEGRIFVTAGAGIQLGRTTEPDLKTEHTLTELLWQDGLAMPGLTGYQSPTLGGIIVAGADGGSVYHAARDAIWGLRYVDGEGQLKEAWRNDTSNPEEFNILRVSIGLMGIIYEYILKPDPAFCIQRIHRSEVIRIQDAIAPNVTLKGQYQPGISSTPIMTARTQEVHDSEYGRIIIIPFARPVEGHLFRDASSSIVYLTTDTRMHRVPAVQFEDGSWGCETVPDVAHYSPNRHDMLSKHTSMVLGMFSRWISQRKCFSTGEKRSQPQYWNSFLKQGFIQEVLALTKDMLASSNSNGRQSGQLVDHVVEHCLQKLLSGMWDSSTHGFSHNGPEDPLRIYLSCAGLRVGYSGAASAAGGATEDSGSSTSTPHVGPSHLLLPVDACVDLRHHPLDFSEQLIPLDETKPTQRLDYILGVIEQMFARDITLSGRGMQIEFYMGKADTAWMGPHYSRNSSQTFLRVNPMQNRIRDIGGDDLPGQDYQYYMSKCWAALDAAGVQYRSHWSKHFPTRIQHEVSLCNIRKNVLRLNEWREEANKRDPHRIFRDTYWNRVLFDKLKDCEY